VAGRLLHVVILPGSHFSVAEPKKIRKPSYLISCSHSRARYFRAHGHKRAGPTRARSRSLVDKPHSASAGTAIGGHEHLILITCRRACRRAAINKDSANRIFVGGTGGGRPGRTGLPFFAPRTGWSRRSWFSLFAGRTCGTGFSLWPLGTLTATHQAKGGRNQERYAFRSHASTSQFMDTSPWPPRRSAFALTVFDCHSRRQLLANAAIAACHCLTVRQGCLRVPKTRLEERNNFLTVWNNSVSECRGTQAYRTR
jgi:hypothetical protein